MTSASAPRRLHRKTRAEIHLRNVSHNFGVMRSYLAPGAFCCPMVKANAYGHGDIEVAKALVAAGARHLGVGLIEEGARLREGGSKAAILTFGPVQDGDVEAVEHFDLVPVISDRRQLETLASQLSKPRDVHVKFNTGMNRLGFRPEEAANVRAFLDSHANLRLAGVCTHLARGEDVGQEGGDSEHQFAVFNKAVSLFRDKSIVVHALNSAGIAALGLRRKASANVSGNVSVNASGVGGLMGGRPGIAIYGAEPLSRRGENLKLEPVMRLVSEIVAVHELNAGERVSYNGTWQAQGPARVGVVPIGYADGMFRCLSNKAEALCRGRRTAVIGTVCMDYLMLNLTEIERETGPIAIGEEVVLMGSQGSERVSAEEIAARAGTISYEVFTRVSERVPRVYI